MIARLALAIFALWLTVALFAQAQNNAPSNPKPRTSKQSDEGERLFEANCGRCHRPPDQLSPKAAGSVLRHMRVRAMLSKEDEQQILKYLAP
jgi:mono/diheme cytochrome c family protein